MAMKKGFIQRRKRVMPATSDQSVVVAHTGLPPTSNEHYAASTFVDPDLQAQDRPRSQAGFPLPVDFTSYETDRNHHRAVSPDVSSPETISALQQRTDGNSRRQADASKEATVEDKKQRKRAKREGLAAQIARMQQEMQDMSDDEDENAHVLHARARQLQT